MSSLKQCNISRDKISLKLRKETSITFLKVRVTKKNTLKRLSKESLSLPRERS